MIVEKSTSQKVRNSRNVSRLRKFLKNTDSTIVSGSYRDLAMHALKGSGENIRCFVPN